MRRRTTRLKNKQTEEPTVNLTPLIDVVFVILIIFIVIAPILDLDQIQLADASRNPKDQSITIKDSGPITIHVHQDDTIYLNSQVVDMLQLPHLLKLEKRKYPNDNPQIYHDKRAKFGTYQSIKNAAETAGFDQMEIVLK